MKNKVLIAIIALYAVIMFMAPFISGKNDLTPRVLKNTWESESVSLTFSGRDKVTVSDGSVTVEGKYVNGTTGTTLVAASTVEKDIMSQIAEADKKGAAKIVGKVVAERAINAGIKTVVFDRGGYIYTGRVAELAAGAREGGLDF